jgi:alcohol dehydrogenase
MPVEIAFGENILHYQAKKITAIGKKCLIVTGKLSASKCGALDDIKEAFSILKISYQLFDQITENPNEKVLIEGAELMKLSQCDFVIGIGGGSPIDAAKAISILAKNHLKVEDLYRTNKFNSAYPIVAVPTTSGTGTESTPYSVITNTQTSIKAGFGSPLLFPKLAFLDPNYTRTLPFSVTRDTAIDALSHLLEGLYSNQRNKLNYPLIYEGVKLIYQYLKLCLTAPENYEWREKLMIASLYGGIVIAQSGTTLQHSIGYPLTTNLGISHGYANGLVMKPIMELYEPVLKVELNSLFTYLNITKAMFYDWLSEFDFKLSQSLTESFLETRIPEVLHSKNMTLNPLSVQSELIKYIYVNLPCK